MTSFESLGSRLHRTRIDIGLSLPEVLARTGLTARRIRLIEGNVVEPLAGEVRDLARLYGRSIDDLARTHELHEELLQFGRRLRAARERCDVAVDEVACRVGIDTERLLAIERGQTEPLADEACHLAMLFGVTLDALAGRGWQLEEGEEAAGVG